MSGERWGDRIRARVGTVRLRITLVAVLVTGVALVLGAVALVAALRELLADEVAHGAQVRSAEVAATIGSGGMLKDLLVEDPEDEAIQILDASGTVLVSSENADGLPALAAPGSEAVEILIPIGDIPFVAAATDVNTSRGRLTVVVARTLEPVQESSERVALLLTYGLPVLAFVIAMTSWVLVGRSMAPVEAIRREVDEISAAELHRRLPETPGGDEITRLARTMNCMLERVDRGHQRQRRFVSDAAHELRTPVAVIRQHAEVALAYPERSSLRELAATVMAEGTRVQQLIEDLLLLARADERSMQLHRRHVDLDDVVFDEARRLRDTTDLRIETSRVSAGQVDGDEAALRRVLRNLGENAARHARTRVSFGLYELAGDVELTVDDDGVGIPVADRERVLERFVRLDAARARDGGGSGLGLAIVAELVVGHGGTVEVTDCPDGGTRIQLRLPASDGAL